MSGEIIPYEAKMKDVRGLLEKLKPQMAMALPKHITPDRLMRITLTSITRTPALLDCDRTSLLRAVMEACQLGLEPDNVLGHAYLLPFKGKVMLIPGYRGLVELARRSGQVSTIYAENVREKDEFDYEMGLEPTLRHKPLLAEDRGKPLCTYAVCKLKDGGVQFVVMPEWEIQAIAKRSPSVGIGPWKTDTDEMRKKTAVRRLCKMIPAMACSISSARRRGGMWSSQRRTFRPGDRVGWMHRVVTRGAIG
jgi:recombination protein RecT